MKKEELILAINVPVIHSLYNLTSPPEFVNIYSREIMRIVIEKIDQLHLSLLSRNSESFILKGKTRTVKKFIRWYKREIIRYRGLRVTYQKKKK